MAESPEEEQNEPPGQIVEDALPSGQNVPGVQLLAVPEVEPGGQK
jgi:hypothetical protein